jgi:hypothetical protein
MITAGGDKTTLFEFENPVRSATMGEMPVEVFSRETEDSSL